MNSETIKLFWDVFKNETIEKQYIFYLLDNQWNADLITIDGNEFKASIVTSYVTDTAKKLSSLGIKEVFVAHNHPKQRPEPSFPDQFQMKYLESIFNLFEIHMDDYLIFSPFGYVSFKENDMMDKQPVFNIENFTLNKLAPLPFVTVNDIEENKEKIISLMEQVDELLLCKEEILRSQKINTPVIFDNYQEIDGKTIFIFRRKNDLDELERIKDIERTINPIEIFAFEGNELIPMKLNGLI
jgi:hypothetical protein